MTFSSTWQTPALAWQWLMSIIEQHGDSVLTEDNQLTKECRNVMVEVRNPYDGWPIQGSGWDLPALDVYAQKEILSTIIPEGFRYSYGGRLFSWSNDRGNGTDQICDIIYKLQSENATRRAIAITWRPTEDYDSDSVPCLQSVHFLHRAGKLHAACYFRSQDIKQAWPANCYGLAKLLQYVAKEAGMEPGSLTTISSSAHVYIA